MANEKEKLLGIPDDNNNKDKDKTKSKIKINKKTAIILGVVLLIVVAALINDKIQKDKIEAVEEKEAQEVSAEQKEREEALSEEHKTLEYYLNKGTQEQALDATAMLVSHTLKTGCKKSYDILREYYKGNSMQYLFNSVSGYDCTKYKNPPFTKLIENDDEADYLLKLASKERYLLIIYKDTETGAPYKFKICFYSNKKDILEEGVVNPDTDYSSNKEEPTTETESTTTTETESTTTTTETTTETTTAS